MLYLKNIKKDRGQISSAYYPEASSEKGYICIDIKSGNILKCETTSYDIPLKAYLSHAAQALSEIADMNELPSEKTVMWY